MGVCSLLFRPEVEEFLSDRMATPINLSPPISWRVSTLLIAASMLVGFTTILFIPYTDYEEAEGTLIPSSGILSVHSSKPGTLLSLKVTPGQVVRKGQILGIVSTDSMGESGSLQGAIINSIITREREIKSQLEFSKLSSDASGEVYKNEVLKLNKEIESLNKQILAQRSLVQIARRRIDQVIDVARKGFISRNNLDEREETLLTRQQQLESLNGALNSKKSELRNIEDKRKADAFRASQNLSAFEENGLRAQQDRYLAQGEKQYALVAPAGGQIGSVALSSGQYVGSDIELLTIITLPVHLEAHLKISGRAAGRAKVGAEVRVEPDAFPVQRYGSLVGRLTSVSTAPSNTSDSSASLYRANVQIERSSLEKFNKNGRLLPGMTVRAYLSISRKPFYYWVIGDSL